MGLMSFLTGGSKSKSKSTSSSSSSSSNQAYPYISSAFSPFVSRGNSAGDMFSAMLGLGSWGGGYAPSYGAPSGGTGGGGGLGPSGHTPLATASKFGGPGALRGFYEDDREYAPQGSAVQALTNPGGYAPAASQDDAFARFRDATGFQHLLNDGIDAVQGNAASRGLLNSGSTLKGLEKFRMGLSNTFIQQFMDNLLKQQSAGLQGGALISGSGQTSSSTGTSTGTSKGSSSGGLLDVLKSVGQIAGGFA